MEALEFLELVEKDTIVFIQQHLSSNYLDNFFFLITDLHKEPYFIFFILIPILVLWIWKERLIAVKRLVYLISIIAINDFICGKIIKKITLRERPFDVYTEIIQKSPASGYSFVSNHAANMLVLTFLISHFYPKLRSIMISLFLIVSFSRVYNGVHYISDVFVGSIVGFVIAKLGLKIISQGSSK